MTPLNTSHSKPVISYPTALLQDVEVITTHDARLGDYQPLEYGSLYPDQIRFPGLKLIHQEPIDGEDRLVRRFWAADRQNQDLYNADFKYSGGSDQHPVIIRRYLLPESSYSPLQTGTADSQFPEAKLVQEEVSQPENRNGYLSVTRVFETLPGPALTGKLVTDKGQVATITTQVVAPGTTVTPSALTVSASVKPDSQGKSVLEKVEVTEVFSEARFTAEKPEIVPTQFRAAVPEETTEFVEIGEAEMPVLDQEGDKAASQEQLTKFTKRVRRVRRDLSNVSEELQETNVDEAGIVETITKTLQTGPQTVTPSATVRGQVEELGDGLTLKTEVEKAKIFGGKTLAAERPDPVPEKFRVAVPTKTVEETVTGTASDPVLVGGEIAESEQQVTEFTKRTRKVTRDIPKDNQGNPVPVELTQKATTPEGLLASVTETFQAGDTAITPTAKIRVESEAIGDGNYIVRKTELPEVFSGKVLSIENPDPVPQKFRVAVPSLTEEENVEGTASISSLGTLGTREFSKSEQQITKHVKRIRKVSRGAGSLPKTLAQKQTTNEGLFASVSEVLQEGDTNETPTATKIIESEAVGDGTYVVRTTTLPEVFNAKVQTTERPDLFPEKFRASFPVKTEETILEGTVSDLGLTTGEISSSEQQLTKFTKRRRKVKRDLVPLPKSLTQISTNDQQQTVFVTETLQTGETTRRPSATVSVRSESLGEGSYVVRAEDAVEVLPAPVYSIETNDLTPPKFRNRLASRSEEVTKVGTAGKPELSSGELSKTVTQVDKYRYRSRVVKKPKGILPTSFTQVSTNDKSQRVIVTETLDKNDTTLVPSALVNVESEAIGDGNYLIRKTEIPGVFSGKVFSSERPENVPLKFRSKLPTVVEEETVEGQAAAITLNTGEVSVSEQQLTAFTKRKRKAYRSTASLPQILTQTATNDKGQKVTITETFKSGDTTETPSATKQVESEALGDGTYVIRTSTVGEVFNEKRIEVRKVEVIPEKFKAASPIQIVEEVSSGSTVSTPALGSDTLSISLQRTTNDTIRTVTTTRSSTSLNELRGQQYDEKLDVIIPYTEKVTASGAYLGNNSTEVVPLSGDFDLVRISNFQAIKAKLESVHLRIPTTATVNLPDKLISATVVWGKSKGEGSSTESSSGFGKSFAYNNGASHQSSDSVAGDVSFVFEKGYSGPVPATRHIFFLPTTNSSQSQILTKVGASSWPVVKMRSQNLVLIGRKSNKRVSKGVGKSRSIDYSTAYLTSSGKLSYSGDSGSDSSSQSTDYDVGSVVNSVAVPPALNSGVFVGSQTFGEGAISGSYYPSSIPATSPSVFPTGSFLLDVSEEIYGYGFVKITALVVNITSSYV